MLGACERERKKRKDTSALARSHRMIRWDGTGDSRRKPHEQRSQKALAERTVLTRPSAQSPQEGLAVAVPFSRPWLQRSTAFLLVPGAETHFHSLGGP